MEESKKEHPYQPRWLPVVHIDEDDYIVDFRLREFWTATPPNRMIEFIPFDSERGDLFMRNIAIVPCAICGELQAQPRDAIRKDVRCFRCTDDPVQ